MLLIRSASEKLMIQDHVFDEQVYNSLFDLWAVILCCPIEKNILIYYTSER